MLCEGSSRRSGSPLRCGHPPTHEKCYSVPEWVCSGRFGMLCEGYTRRRGSRPSLWAPTHRRATQFQSGSARPLRHAVRELLATEWLAPSLWAPTHERATQFQSGCARPFRHALRGPHSVCHHHLCQLYPKLLCRLEFSSNMASKDPSLEEAGESTLLRTSSSSGNARNRHLRRDEAPARLDPPSPPAPPARPAPPPPPPPTPPAISM